MVNFNQKPDLFARVSRSQSGNNRKSKILERFILIYGILVFGIFIFWVVSVIRFDSSVAKLKGFHETIKQEASSVLKIENIKHLPIPESVRGIYITASTASISKFDKLLELVDKTELNAIVLDIKDWKGRPAFNLKRETLQEFSVSDPVIRDIDLIVQKAHNKGIYLIGRIAVFQDSYLVAKKPEWALKSKWGGAWRDWKGVSWVDPTHPDVWEYNVELAREAYERGFDEINFDYIRFPSDGPIEQIVYASYDGKVPKYLAMKKFFGFLDHELRAGGVPISADLFGLTMEREDGLGIGQRFVDAAPFFDAISPMVYPSHYPYNFKGFKNPAAHPYEIINPAMRWGVEKRKELMASGTLFNASGKGFAELRPWLQDFDLGANYDAPMIRKEIQATYDAGLSGWLLWNAANNYTEEALEKN